MEGASKDVEITHVQLENGESKLSVSNFVVKPSFSGRLYEVWPDSQARMRPAELYGKFTSQAEALKAIATYVHRKNK